MPLLLSAGPRVGAQVLDEEKKIGVRPTQGRHSVPSTSKGEAGVVRSELQRWVDESRSHAGERQHYSQHNQEATDEQCGNDRRTGVDGDGVSSQADDDDTETDTNPGDHGSLAEEPARLLPEVDVGVEGGLAGRLRCLRLRHEPARDPFEIRRRLPISIGADWAPTEKETIRVSIARALLLKLEVVGPRRRSNAVNAHKDECDAKELDGGEAFLEDHGRRRERDDRHEE